MAAEIEKRQIDCIEDHRNIFWYRGENTKSMLDKFSKWDGGKGEQ
tara:strand:+ start:330 stop:464 length:135 start_codon:yes stop_codon:yes gene_type:complete